jgi:hypothetical protein
MTVDAWVQEFRKRASWVLAPEHFRHGFIGEILGVNEVDQCDPTFEGTDAPSMEITIEGDCPCGEHVSVWSGGIYESVELIRALTSPTIAEDMAANTNPFVVYSTE